MPSLAYHLVEFLNFQVHFDVRKSYVDEIAYESIN